MWELEKSLQQHGFEISGWILPPPGDPYDLNVIYCEEDADLPIEDRAVGQAFLPYDLETSFELLAERKGHPIEAYQLGFLCVAASLIPSQSRLVVDSFSGDEVPPILWGGLVGDPGSGETYIINTLIRPLRDLQVEHDILYTTDYTAKTVDRILVQHPGCGLLVSPGELAPFLWAMTSGRGSRGSEHSRWISLYDGNGLTVKRTFVQHPSVSVIGGIRPPYLQHWWQERRDYSDDIWACFAWMRICLSPNPDIRDKPFYNPRWQMDGLYQRLQTFPPARYVLSRVGQQVWREWVEKIDDLICNETNERIRMALSRTKERAARVALVLHCLDAAYVHLQPGTIVPADTLLRAIRFVYRLQGWARLIHDEVWGNDLYKSHLAYRFVEQFKTYGPVDLDECRNWWPSQQKPSTDKLREFLDGIVQSGCARWVDEWQIEII